MDVAVVGGGAAGFFAAVTVAESAPGRRVVILEKGARVLAKVRISGGGRCNVTHACFEPRELVRHYPRGGRALVGAFHRWGPREMVEWLEGRGVVLKTEQDGRMFPVTDDSRTITDCLEAAAREGGVEVRTGAGVRVVRRQVGGGFELETVGGVVRAGRVLLAHGGLRAGDELACGLGHTLVPPVPSLFSFQIKDEVLEGLAGVSVGEVEASVAACGERQRGAVVVTHDGLSGPAVLRLSAWAARWIHEQGGRFDVEIDWLPGWDGEGLRSRLREVRENYPKREVGTRAPVAELPQRLWARLAGTGRWGQCSNAQLEQLVGRLKRTRLGVSGRRPNKEEFVTAGGVALEEIDFRTMESRVCPGLHVAGEALDIDGVTGGFNFQAAWTTGRLAGLAMARA